MMNKKGFAMALNLVIIVVLTILASALLLRGAVASKRTEGFVDQTRAFWMAESGVAKAVYALNNGSWAGWTAQGNNRILQGSLGTAGDYDITVYNYLSANARIESTGFFPSRIAASPITRKVEVLVSKANNSLFKYAAFAEGTLSLSGQGSTDSYDSSLGAYGGANIGSDGDVGSNTEFSGSGQAYVDGDINIPVGETAPAANYYSGTVIEEDKPTLTTVSVPANLTTLTNLGSISSTTTLNPGDYQYWMINVASHTTVTLVGPINLYLTGTTAIKVAGQAEIYIDPASAGPVNIYFDGDVSLTGQGITNGTSVPANLILYGTGTTQDIKLSGQGDFYGGIYAPNSDLKLTGQGSLLGAFVGNTVTISGQGGIHYDTQLGSAGASAVNTYSITSWSDTQNSFGIFQ
ncbi:MAG: hypothetical protein KJ915_07165 [Candidatus Omnitrophica bacterium]|nr:hypothetical protein [Candidatus Omnitrophota bacterium]